MHPVIGSPLGWPAWVAGRGWGRPARLPPLAGSAPRYPSSSDSHEAHDEAPGTAQEPLRVMVHIQVKFVTIVLSSPLACAGTLSSINDAASVWGLVC